MAFDFGAFLQQTNSKLDDLQKRKERISQEKMAKESAFKDRQMAEVERAGRSQSALADRAAKLEERKYSDASDNEYNRRKAAFDVRAGNMDQGTFDTLYGGGSQGGGGRGMRGGSQGGEPDYTEMITKAYANKPEDDMRSFADFARDEMGSLRRDNPFPQTQQPMSTSDMYKAGDLRNRMNFEQNVQSSRGYDGKLRFSDNAASPILGGAATQAQGWDASRMMAQNRMSMFAGNQNQPSAYDPSMEQKRFMGATSPAAQRGTSITPDSTGLDPFLTAQNKKRPPYKLEHGDYTAFTSPDYTTGVRSTPVPPQPSSTRRSSFLQTKPVTVDSSQFLYPVPPQPDRYDALRKALRNRRNLYGPSR